MNAPALNLFASPQGAAPQGSAAPVDGGMFGVFDALLASLTGEAAPTLSQPQPTEDPATETVQAEAAPETAPATAFIIAFAPPPAPTVTPAAPSEGEAALPTVPQPTVEAAPQALQPTPDLPVPETPETVLADAEPELTTARPTPTDAPPAAKAAPQPVAREAAQAPAAPTPANDAAPVSAEAAPAVPDAPQVPAAQAARNPVAQAQVQAQAPAPVMPAAPPAATPEVQPVTKGRQETRQARAEGKAEAAAPGVQARPNAEAPAPTLGEETIELAGGDIPLPDAAPDPEAPPSAELKPAPAANAAPQANAAAALEAHVPAAPVRGSPETVAHLTAQILQKLDSQTTRFEIALDPLGLGHVDVSMEIGTDGKLTASLSFDTPQAAAELRGRAGELRQALEQAGFELSRDSLSFDVAHQGHRERETPERNPRNARAFQAVMASDEEIAALPHAFDRRTSGVDVRI